MSNEINYRTNSGINVIRTTIKNLYNDSFNEDSLSELKALYSFKINNNIRNKDILLIQTGSNPDPKFSINDYYSDFHKNDQIINHQHMV